MPSSRRILTALLLLSLAVSCPLVAHAQFGGLKDRLKKKASQMVSGKPATPSAEAAEGTEAAEPEAPDTNVVVITATVLTRVETGLRAEAVRRKEVETALRLLKTPEQYNQCTVNFDTSPAGSKLMQEMEPAGQDQVKLGEIMKRREAALVAHCGHDPGSYEYKRKLNASIPTSGAAPSKFSDLQYSILRERVLVFFSKNGQEKWHVQGDRNGAGRYVFTPAEVEALNAQATVLRELLKDQT